MKLKKSFSMLGLSMGGLISLNAIGASPEPSNYLIFEAEDHAYSIADPGSSDIESTSGSSFNSGRVMKMFDKGDTLGFDIHAQNNQTRNIKLRVRVGHKTSRTGHANSYHLKVNGQNIVLNLDEYSVSEKDGSYGGVHWGTLNADAELNSGINTLALSSDHSWMLADYIAISPEVDSPTPDRLEAEDHYAVVNDPSPHTIVSAAGSTHNSNRVLNMYDKSDKVKFNIASSVNGNQELIIRARVGNKHNKTGHVNGYRVNVNGTTYSLTLDESTLSGYDQSYGGVYWGSLKGNIPMTFGSNIVEVESLHTWMILDYLELENGSPSNQVPIANAGPDIVTSETSIVLNGSNSYDPDGSIATYSWNKISGPSVSLGNTDSATLQLSDLQNGLYEFELRVTDNEGNANTDTVKVTKNSGPEPKAGIFYTSAEVDQWKERAGIIPGTKMYVSQGDVVKNSPAEWERIKRYADDFVSNNSIGRYTNYFNRDSCLPNLDKNAPNHLSHSELIKFDPVGKDDHLVNAAFVYLLTGDEKYAKPVRNEIMRYTTIRHLEPTNSTVFCSDNYLTSVHDHFFFLSLWFQKLLVAYDYTKDSNIWSDADKARFKEWQIASAKYYQAIINMDMGANSAIPGRLNGDYSNIAERLRNLGSTPEYTHDNTGTAIPVISYYYNNRRANMVHHFFSVGAYYNVSDLIDDGIRYFKENVAYGMVGTDAIIGDVERSGCPIPGKAGKEDLDERGMHYSWVTLHDLIDMADIYARTYGNDLYEFEIGDAELNEFFPANEYNGTPLYNSLAKKGKSLKKSIDTHLNYYNGSYGDSRKICGYVIDGWRGVSGKRNMHYVWAGKANLYYQNSDWTTTYTGDESNPHSAYPDKSKWVGPGAAGATVGVMHTSPGYLFMYGLMEGKVWPYVN